MRGAIKKKKLNEKEILWVKLSWETASWKQSGLNVSSAITHVNTDYFHGELNLQFNKHIQSGKTVLS